MRYQGLQVSRNVDDYAVPIAVPSVQFFIVSASVVSYVMFGLSLVTPHLSSIGASDRVCFVIVAFTRYLYIYV